MLKYMLVSKHITHDKADEKNRTMNKINSPKSSIPLC